MIGVAKLPGAFKKGNHDLALASYRVTVTPAA